MSPLIVPREVTMRHCPRLLFIFALSCPGWAEAVGQDSAAPSPSFAKEVEPLLRSKCLRCHGGDSRKADLDLSTPSGIRKGGESGPSVVPGKPEESLLFEKVHNGEMPPGKKNPLGAAEIETLRRWIVAGARTGEKENVATTPAVSQHDVLPILLRHCTVCHGPRRKQGGLDLTSKASILRGGKSGPAIVPGAPDRSLLIKRVRMGQMPPPQQLVEGSVKPVDPGDAKTLETWVAAGAPEVVVAPDVATTTPDPLVTDRDRDFWAFKPPRAARPPASKPGDPVRNPIDAFVLEKLRAKGLSFSPEADRATLLRRATFDLTGLPPRPEDIRAFLADSAPDAYERLIDRLLASPRYGERWAAFWLDLAGYADSEGKREQDLPRPNAWRYRDYVIKSLNADKPYDRFLLEQIAGDELADYERASVITREIADNLIATGFLRMAPDASWANITGYVTDRVEVVADEMDILGSAVMGLTLKCARCHAHKFDPIPQRDYYRLIDVFKGAYDEYDWLKPDVRPGLGPVSTDAFAGRLLPHVPTVEREGWRAAEAAIRKESNALRNELESKAKIAAAAHLEKKLAELPEVLRYDLKRMLTTATPKRDAVQRYLAEKFEAELKVDRDALKRLDSGFKAASDRIEASLKALEAARRPEPKIQALWDRGEPSPTYVYRRGDVKTPGRLVGPGVPSVLTDGKTPFEVKPPWPGAKSTGRRLAFAKWLTRPDHPLTARVAVNRVWKHHFGSGIVKTLGNFGKAGAPPTHPELLDRLAIEFINGGWSLKAIHRLIMTSTTYRQSSSVIPETSRLDPDNAVLSRMPMVRLDVEQLYDTLLDVAGRLDDTPHGPGDPVQVRGDGQATPIGTARGYRRMIYVQHTRKHPPTILENFDYPQMNPNCVERRDSVVPLQALQLMNSGMTRELADRFAERVSREVGEDSVRRVERVYLLALGRFPADAERGIGVEALAGLKARWAAASPDGDAGLKALSTYCHAIMNSAAFLHVD